MVYIEQKYSRAARFQLNPKDSEEWSGESFNRPQYTLLDEIMSEIPGKDNYPGNLTDEAFDLPAHSMDLDKNGKLNSAYYHRWFRVMEKDAMGQSMRCRGYSEENLFVAMTTQSKVAGMNVRSCKRSKGKPDGESEGDIRLSS